MEAETGVAATRGWKDGSSPGIWEAVGPGAGEGQEGAPSGGRGPASRHRQAAHGGRRAGEGEGLGHSLGHLALHTDDTRPHKPDLARGRVPAQAPGQAGHPGAQDLDDIAASEGHLFRPGALVVCHC